MQHFPPLDEDSDEPLEPNTDIDSNEDLDETIPLGAEFVSELFAEAVASSDEAPPAPDDPGDILAALVAKARQLAPSTPKRRRTSDQVVPNYTYSPGDYTSTAYVLLLVEIQCRNCGSLSRSTNGIFLEQRHRSRDESNWKRIDPNSLTSTLPRRRETRTMQVEVCLDCAPSFGF